MDITLVVCTYNRSQSLAKSLESIAASQLPESLEWEVVVVDNNSHDQTSEIVESFCRRYPQRFRYVFEPAQGLSYARNAGIRQARGNVIAFTDDDLTVQPDWLKNLTAPLRDEKWAGAGGRILPAQSFVAPRWYAPNDPYNMGGVLYAHFDLGDQAGELDRAPHGANMAFRKSLFDKYGDFRVYLGVSPGTDLCNEDTEFGRRLMAGGERLCYVPSAVVYHEISAKRLNKKYFLKWWYGYGRSQMREAGDRSSILGIPRPYLSVPHIALRHLPVRVLQWLFSVNPQKRFYRKCMVSVALGWLVETCHLAHRQKNRVAAFDSAETPQITRR
jgi:glucosyl-dolichyl phosphate glucuronosyltransferase